LALLHCDKLFYQHSEHRVTNSEIEVIHPDHVRGDFRAVLFDFDGTLSLLRRNWQDTMIPMMVEILVETGTTETREQLHSIVEDFVMRLNGRQTIYQMMQLADEVAKRGGQPLEPLAYKHRYHDLLWQHVSQRIESVRSGRVPRDEMTVPGSRQLLQRFTDSRLNLYLASGTDLKYVRDEVNVLGLTDYFGQHIYGALDDYKKFSKGMIIQQIIRETGVPGRQILGFGDGFVEIEELKKVGGLAVGVASNEETRSGINDWKRRRLIEAGADLIIPDYRSLDSLMLQLGL
jgi:beta-phosphoglucomutase-like phosphatase (HAD superfamily)